MPLWDKHLNSDAQQFNQYQQNEQSPLKLNSLNIKKDHNIWH